MSSGDAAPGGFGAQERSRGCARSRRAGHGVGVRTAIGGFRNRGDWISPRAPFMACARRWSISVSFPEGQMAASILGRMSCGEPELSMRAAG